MKYDMGDMIHYMNNNKAVNSRIQARVNIEPAESDITVVLEIKRPNGYLMDMKDRRVEDVSGNYYVTRHGIVAEDDAYPSKEKLLVYL